jgi:hypothetical protein
MQPEKEVPMASDARAVVTASLAADALALGALWIYDWLQEMHCRKAVEKDLSVLAERRGR